MTFKEYVSRDHNHASYECVREEFRHDASLGSGVVKGFHGNSPYWTTNGCGRWANSNCFGITSPFLRPFLVHGLLKKIFVRKRWGCHRSPLTQVIRGVSKVFIRTILVWGRELQRLNFFFLWCSWFGRGLNKWITGYGCKVKGWIRLMRDSHGATWTPTGVCKDRWEKQNSLRCDLGFPFLPLEFYVQMNH